MTEFYSEVTHIVIMKNTDCSGSSLRRDLDSVMHSHEIMCCSSNGTILRDTGAESDNLLEGTGESKE
jgi:hypothetical protein